MFEIFSQEMDVTIVMLFLFVLSILCKLIPGIWYRHLIREVDNMAGTSSTLLKQCKLKFSNCYQLNGRVANIGIFVDKFISRLKVGPFSFDGVDHFSRQALVLSIFAAGIGVCRSLIKGRYFLEIMPFYLTCFIAIYLYYMVAGMVDIKNLKALLRVNLIDYLENHLFGRLYKTSRDLKEVFEDEAPVRKRTVNEIPKKETSKESPLIEIADRPAQTETKRKTATKRTAKQTSVTEKTKADLKTEQKTEQKTELKADLLKDPKKEVKEEIKGDTKKETKIDTKEDIMKDIKIEEKKDIKENPVPEQVPPRSIDPEEIRKVLQELLGYSQA